MLQNLFLVMLTLLKDVKSGNLSQDGLCFYPHLSASKIYEEKRNQERTNVFNSDVACSAEGNEVCFVAHMSEVVLPL